MHKCPVYPELKQNLFFSCLPTYKIKLAKHRAFKICSSSECLQSPLQLIFLEINLSFTGSRSFMQSVLAAKPQRIKKSKIGAPDFFFWKSFFEKLFRSPGPKPKIWNRRRRRSDRFFYFQVLLKNANEQTFQTKKPPTPGRAGPGLAGSGRDGQGRAWPWRLKTF